MRAGPLSITGMYIFSFMYFLSFGNLPAADGHAGTPHPFFLHYDTLRRRKRPVSPRIRLADSSLEHDIKLKATMADPASNSLSLKDISIFVKTLKMA